jgi:hypothetical protein
MASGAVWMKEISKLDENKIVELLSAIKVLCAWPMFVSEWGWTGIKRLGYLLEDGLREKQQQQIKGGV